MRELIPWWARIGTKVVLSRVPAGYALWRRFNLFAHGAMHQAEYALRVFQEHFARAQLAGGRKFVAMELGPGDSLSSAVIAAAQGATHTYLVDAGHYATQDMGVYHDLARHLQTQGMAPPALDDVRDLDGLLSVCHASYGTMGLRSLREVPSGSVDFIWSHAVLEHIRRHEFLDFMGETRRVLKKGGRCSHQIDLRDHLGGALNNLRISSRWWEAPWMARSGFYTNRLRRSELIPLFESAGFAVEVVSTTRWETSPTPESAFAQEFQGFDAAELLLNGFAVVLTPV